MNSIKHILHDKKFDANFKCENGILKTPYLAETLIVGTFNPNTPNSNHADFFYGRNYFWTALKNIFIHQEVKILGSRMPKNGKPKKPLNPNLEEILILCEKLKLTFADLILEVLNNDAEYHILDNDNICYENKTFNLIQDNNKGQIYGLSELDNLNQVNWNTKNIIKFLCENPQIKTIYFTRQPTGIWEKKWNEIKKDKCSENRTFKNLFTPSGQGKPVLNSMARLLNHWLFNTNEKFGKLEHKLIKNINISKFRITE